MWWRAVGYTVSDLTSLRFEPWTSGSRDECDTVRPTAGWYVKLMGSAYTIFFFFESKSNQIFHYTRCNIPKRVTSWRGPFPQYCARATQLLSKKCRSGGELLATLCSIWPARDLNLRPPAPETNALPLDQLTGLLFYFVPFKTTNKTSWTHIITIK